MATNVKLFLIILSATAFFSLVLVIGVPEILQEETFGPVMTIHPFKTDKEAIEAFKYCSKLEGIIPALEPSHALAHLKKIAPKMSKKKIIVMNMCGRGDKDIFTVAEKINVKIHE